MITTHSRFGTSFRNIENKLYRVYICDREYNKLTLQDGFRYNWFAVTDARSITPFGWNISTSEQLDLIGDEIIADTSVINPNMLGYRSGVDGTFTSLTTEMTLWSINALNSTDGIHFTYGIPTGATLGNDLKKYGYPVRMGRFAPDKAAGEIGTVTGNDGKVYPTICLDVDGEIYEITTENLAETKFRNGETIPEVTDNAEWAALTTAGRCSYDNQEGNAFTVGDDPETLYVAGSDGFTLEYESDDILCPSIVSSRCQLPIILNEDIKPAWDDFIQDLLTSDDETRFYVYITENSEPYWLGLVQIERLKVPDEYYTRVTLTATDGFGLLGSIPYDNNGTLYTGWDTISQHVTNILKKLHLHDELTTSMIAHVSNWDPSEFVNPFSGIRFQHNAMKEFKGELTLPFDCLTVLKQILRRFNLRLVQMNTVFFFQNYRTLAESGSVDVDFFDNTGTFLETDTIPFNYTTLSKLRGGNSFYREQAKYASVNYGYKDAIQGSNMFGIFPIDENTPFNLGEIPAGNGETVGFGFDFRLYVLSSINTFYVQFIFTIQSGTYYLSKGVDSPTMSWVDGATDARVRFNSMWPFVGIANSIEPVGFIIPEAPATNDMIFTWTWTIVDSISGEELTPGTGSVVVLTRNEATIIYAISEPNEGTIVTTASGGNLSGEIVQPELLVIGDLPYLRSVGRLQYYGVAEEWLNTDRQWGYDTVDTYSIDELLALELAAFQRVPTKILSLKLNSDVFFAYKLDGNILLRGMYVANLNQWSVECYEPNVNASGLTLSAYVDTENTGGISGTLVTPPTPVISTDNYWKRTGTLLEPNTSGDKVKVSVTGTDIGIEATSVNGSSVRGSASGTGFGGEFTGVGNSALSVNGSSGPIININSITSSANSVFNMIRLFRSTTGSAAAGIGASIDFTIEQSGGSASSSAILSALLTNVSSITSDFVWQLRSTGAALAEVMRLTGPGELLVNKSHRGSLSTAPNSTDQITGSLSRSFLIIDEDLTLDSTHYTIHCATVKGDIIVTLPAASSCTGRCYRIRRWTGTDDVIVTPTGYDSVIGSLASYATLTLTNNGEWIEVQSNGTDWYIVQDNPIF